MSVGAKIALYLFAAALGAALPLLNLPFIVVASPPVVLLLVAMVVAYRAAWRQGHSGVVILPLASGPFGASGLSLRLSATERSVIAAIAAFFVGLSCAAIWVATSS